MKHLYFLIIFLFIFSISNAQIVNIPDSEFKLTLLAASPSNDIAKDVNYNNIKIDVNNNNEIEVSEALLVYRLNVEYDNTPTNNVRISDLTGIAAFENLEILDITFNLIQTLDISMLDNLNYLYAAANPITALNVVGLSNLIRMDINNNQLTTIDFTGLSSLEVLNLGTYQGTTVDITPLLSLKNLAFSSSNLITLNVSSLINLEEIIGSNNSMLQSIDLSGLTNLVSVFLEYGVLNTIDFTGCINLETLIVRSNSLTNLDVSGLTSLEHLECPINQLTTLKAHNLNNLNYINSNENLLNNLDITGLPSLQYLAFNFNSVDTFDPTEFTNLNTLWAEANQLTALNLGGLTNLEVLRCSVNQLIGLDLSSLSNLNIFYASQNQLEYINFKNGIIDDNFHFEDNPDIAFICADNNIDELNFIQNKLNIYGYENCVLNSYCNFHPGGEYYTIQGNVRYDFNTNGCDSFDTPASNLLFNISDGSNTAMFIADASGEYNIPLEAGNYTITPFLEHNNYFSISPTEISVDFPASSNPYLQDFCIAPNGLHPDLKIIVLPLNAARPGFDSNYKLYLMNRGNQTHSGIVTFNFDDELMDYVSSQPLFDDQGTNQFSWNYTDLAPFQNQEKIITFNINSPASNPPVNSGDILNFTANITPVSGDETPSDNNFIFEQTVVNSYDPNDKTCLEGEYVTTAVIGNYVHYLIRFENTGTFQAQNIVVTDNIDTNKFDISSLIPLGGSHQFITNIQNNFVEFIFEDINLPIDDENNEGYVLFQIKTLESLELGDTFSNNASIYFDYNFPIITNTIISTIDEILGIADINFNDTFTIFPNPTEDKLSIQNKNASEISSIEIYNVAGQIVLIIPNSSTEIDVSMLESGNYFIKINTQKGYATSKFIKI